MADNRCECNSYVCFRFVVVVAWQQLVLALVVNVRRSCHAFAGLAGFGQVVVPMLGTPVLLVVFASSAA